MKEDWNQQLTNIEDIECTVAYGITKNPRSGKCIYATSSVQAIGWNFDLPNGQMQTREMRTSSQAGCRFFGTGKRRLQVDKGDRIAVVSALALEWSNVLWRTGLDATSFTP